MTNTPSILCQQVQEEHLAGNDIFDISLKHNITLEETTSLLREYEDSLPTRSQVQARKDEIQRVDIWLSRLDAEYTLKQIPIDKAVSSFCRLSERRSKLLGIDSPSRAEITTLLQSTPSSIDMEIQSLISDLQENDS